MKNEQLYQKTVGILVDAYFNDTLEHGNCYACAVGNIIAGNCGYKYVSGGENIGKKKFNKEFVTVFTGCGDLYWENQPDFHKNPVSLFDQGKMPDLPNNEMHKVHIDSTGYNLYELAAIEYAFERTNKSGTKSDKKMFDGLMSVIDQLDIIHDNKDANVSAVTKQRFVKQF